MAADNIDLTYAEDGRTLKSAKLMDNAGVDLPGDRPGRRKARSPGETIDIAMGSDGDTVTGLTAARTCRSISRRMAISPARRIRSALLAATGAEGAGLQNADVHRQRRFPRDARGDEGRGRRSSAPGGRSGWTCRPSPASGTSSSADFRGNVHFTDGADTSADSSMAIYAVDAGSSRAVAVADP